MSAFTGTKEFHDLRYEFEKIFKTEKLDREQKEMCSLRAFYQNGHTNDLFHAFMQGYQLGRSQ